MDENQEETKKFVESTTVESLPRATEILLDKSIDIQLTISPGGSLYYLIKNFSNHDRVVTSHSSRSLIKKIIVKANSVVVYNHHDVAVFNIL